MTRFARARGSKSSNERVAEEATSWTELKHQLELKKTHANQEESVAKDALRQIKLRKESSGTDWADFGVSHPITAPKASKKRGMEGDDMDSNRKKKKKKTFQNSVAEGENNVAITDSEVTEVPKKKKKIGKFEHSKEKNGTVKEKYQGDLNDDKAEVPIKKKKKLLQNVVIKEQESMVEEKDMEPETKEERKVHKKKKLRKGEDTEDQAQSKGTEERRQETEPSFGKHMKHRKDQASGKRSQHFSAGSAKSDIGNTAPSFKRRKPYIESSTININGISINVTKYDGFDVKSEDAIRLKELRSKMLKEGIPRVEVDKVMKLERRKAEKALAREKKKVCFNCRKAGHLLSECPEVGSFGSNNFDTTTVNLCYKCGSTEHTHFQCQVKKKKEYSFATCFICKEQGHISSQCPDNPRGLYPQGGSCKICGEVTHLKKDCPQLSKERSENTVTLDTISSSSKLEALSGEVDSSKKESKISVKQRKIIKF